MSKTFELEPAALRWRCDPTVFEFTSTAEVEPARGVVGQPLAVEALEFGLACSAPGQNVFVRGQRGTGRMTMIRDVLSSMESVCRTKTDRCFVHNFLQPDRPRLVSLPQGQGRALRRRLKRLAEFVDSELADAMNSKPLKASRTAEQERAQRQISALTEPFEAELADHGLALVQIKTQHGGQTAIFPTWQGQAVPPEQFDQLIEQGQVKPEDRDALLEKREEFSRRLPELSMEISRVMRDSSRRIDAFNEKHLRRLVGDVTESIKQDYNHDALAAFLDEVIDDVVDHALASEPEDRDPVSRYGINILLEHVGNESPVVVESNPTLKNLLGGVDYRWTSHGQPIADYQCVRGGSILAADGGYLVLDAHDLLAEPGAWQILTRTLRTGLLEIVPAEYHGGFGPSASLKPEAIPVHLRVVLMGSAGVYYMLDRNDYDFPELFKVLADFDDTLDRTEGSVQQYAQVLSRIAREEQLMHFAPGGVAALAEHGARIADKAGRLTSRFGRVADLAREAAWLAGRASAETVDGDHVREAVRRTKRRASLPSRRFESYLKDGTINLATSGSMIGQINGLAVMGAGPLKYGFPARITASIGPGHAGIIDIESSAQMSGSIHTKGFHILGGLLRNLLRCDHPLTFSASLAFEQSYGGIDGDSASGAEMICLLSALTGSPLRQDLAITGAIDQHGTLQAIGGVNEKIEGFFDICDHFGLTGTQGVVIPTANAGDLMLRHDVVEAAQSGQFHVFAVDSVVDALGIFAGQPAGTWSGEDYEKGSVLAAARRRATEYWLKTLRRPDNEST